MTALELMGGITGLFLVVIIAASMICLLLWRRLARLQAQQQAWEQAQEVHFQQWKEAQETYIVQLAEELIAQMEALYAEKQKHETVDRERAKKLLKLYKTSIAKAKVELILTHLPRIEDIPLPQKNSSLQRALQAHKPIDSLQGANLAARDLAHRSLRSMDLSQAQLAEANLYMTDLSEANLRGADLSGADLSGANLANADLHGANLHGANLLVTDLNNAILTQADLRDVRNLSAEQLSSAIIDSTTRIDSTDDLTLPLIKRPYKQFLSLQPVDQH